MKRELPRKKSTALNIGVPGGHAQAEQLCRYCPQPARKSLILPNGRYIPVCNAHVEEGRARARSAGLSVIDVRPIVVLSDPHDLMPYIPPDLESIHRDFGQRLTEAQVRSALAEAPGQSLPRASIGRRDSPRGTTVRRRTGKDIQGVKGSPIVRSHGRTAEPTSTRAVGDARGQKKAIPDALLQMLGSDWTTLRANRVHDNRITVTIDGVRYSVYTRRG